MEENEQDKIIYSAVDLWKKLSKSAAFNDVDYDKTLLEEIKSYLNIDINADLLQELENITVEELLNAFFTSIEPFSEMLKELLEVFSNAGAKYTDKNLKIAVNFGELRVDLEKFKTEVKTITEIVSKSVNTYFVSNPWSLCVLFEFDEDYYGLRDGDELDNNEIKDWVITYRNNKLPTYFPNQPKFSKEVDCLIRVIWSYLRRKYEALRAIYKEELGIQDSVREQVKYLRELSDNEHSDEGKHALLLKAKMLQDETDFYIVKMVVDITMFVEHLQTLDASQLDSALKDFKGKYDGIFATDRSVTRTKVVEKIKRIESLLNLPYWKHRYEVYSAWVFTLIVKAFGHSNLKYELVNNDTLSFSFGGSHLATYGQEKPLEIWAECRSEAISAVKGRGRVRGIQPDYTIAFHEAKIPNNAVAVVECKQYKKSSTSNFSKAIIDYANNRPNAKIFLVNYGAIEKTVNQKVISDGIDESRFATFGNVRPQNSDVFIKAFRSYLFEPLTFTLEWGEYPVDLDLMLDVTGPNAADSQCVNFLEIGSKETPPYAVLNDDCRIGYGPEIITVFRVDSGKKYSVHVHKYSPENEISGEITLKVECKAFEKIYTINQIFNLWDVCSVENGQLISIDTVD